MKNSTLKKGWLKKVLDDAEKTYKELPKWMRDLMDKQREKKKNEQT